jgi:hypothetical protein
MNNSRKKEVAIMATRLERDNMEHEEEARELILVDQQAYAVYDKSPIVLRLADERAGVALRRCCTIAQFDLTTHNASAGEPARALVLIGGDAQVVPTRIEKVGTHHVREKDGIGIGRGTQKPGRPRPLRSLRNTGFEGSQCTAENVSLLVVLGRSTCEANTRKAVYE